MDTCTIKNKNLDRKPAANEKPIKNTHVHDTSVGTINVDPFFIGIGMIGQEGYRAISGRSITQEIIPVRKVINHGNIITTDITDPRKIPPRSGSFPIGENQAHTFMLASLVKAFLTRYRNVGTTSIPRTRRINQSRILAPTVYEKFLVGIMSKVLSSIMFKNRMNSTLPLMDQRPMKITLHVYEMYNILRNVSSAKIPRSLIRAVR